MIFKKLQSVVLQNKCFCFFLPQRVGIHALPQNRLGYPGSAEGSPSAPGCRCLDLLYAQTPALRWALGAPCSCGGVQNPRSAGEGCACGPTSERPIWVTRGGPPRLLAGSVVQELKSSTVWGATLSRSAVQTGVALADRVLGVAPWGPCCGEAVRVNSRGRLVTHPSGCQGPAHAVRWT